MHSADLDLELRQIRPDDKLPGLSLGDSAFTPLKVFLQKRVKSFHAGVLAKTYGMFHSAENQKIVGYITLVCGKFQIEDETPLLGAEIGFSYDQYLAVKIARLAVDSRYCERKIGMSLVQFALGVVKDQICTAVGCRFVIVDAKKQSLIFYRKLGFNLFDTETNKRREEPILFVDLQKISVH